MHTFEFLLFLLSVKVKKRTIDYSYVLSIIVTEHESTIVPIISVTMIKTIWPFICHRSRQKMLRDGDKIARRKKNFGQKIFFRDRGFPEFGEN